MLFNATQTPDLSELICQYFLEVEEMSRIVFCINFIMSLSYNWETKSRLDAFF